MRRSLLIGTCLVLAAGGLVAAQTPPTPKSSGAPPVANSASPPQQRPMGPGMMGGGPGMMGGWGAGMMGDGACPMFMGATNTKMEVKKLDKGVSMTVTSSDPATVARLQKMAEAMRLMHEAWNQ